MTSRHSLPPHVRWVLDLRSLWLAQPTVERFRAWLDAFDALSTSEASAYVRAVRRDERSALKTAA
jgi:hypothetical protein